MELIERPGPPTGLRRVLFRAPILLYRAHLGGLLGHRFVLIHHVGRKSGTRREVVVEVVHHDPTTRSVTVASGFGGRADWYRNVLAHPEVTVRLGSATMAVRAVSLSPEQGSQAMLGYARRHPRTARALCRFMGFLVDGTESDYTEVGRRVPFLRLDPVG